MARLKSTVKGLKIEVAERAHNCRYNKSHRIERGDTRLSISEGRSSLTYCKQCAIAFLEADLAKLGGMLEEIRRTLTQA